MSITAHGSPHHPDYFLLRGTQLNGLSQAVGYGDDYAAATNYPIVKLTEVSTGQVSFARTYNWSSTGVALGTDTHPTPTSTDFELPAGL